MMEIALGRRSMRANGNFVAGWEIALMERQQIASRTNTTVETSIQKVPVPAVSCCCTRVAMTTEFKCIYG